MSNLKTDAIETKISILSLPAVSYFEELHKRILSCEISNVEGGSVSFEEGLNLALLLIEQVRVQGNKLMLIGNGGSAAIASHQSLDFCNACKIKAMAFTDSSHLTCFSNDYGYENVFSKSIEMFADRGDLLIALSSSGASKNILNAADRAREKDCKIITFSGFRPDNPLRDMGDLNFYLPSDSYGIVETRHLSLLHYLTDRLKM